jgi:hypothetical protein
VRLGELWVPVRQTEHNLPPERDAFVGRVAELARLHAALDGAARLLTILGAGGIGKTRLARRYGASWLGAGRAACTSAIARKRAVSTASASSLRACSR